MDSREILTSYPLPLASGYRRYLNASEVRERHDAAYYLFEVHLKYVTSAVIACYLSGEARSHRVNAALKGLARPSLGEWVRFLRECLAFFSQQEQAGPFIAAVGSLAGEKRSHPEALLRLYTALCALRTGSECNRGKASLEMILEELVAYRNRILGHGAPLDKEHYARFGELFGRAVPDLLAASPFLKIRRLVAFDSIQVEAGSRLECAVIEYMGDRPVRREQPHTISYGGAAPEKQLLYLLGEDGELLALDPLLLAHREDVYILNECEGAPEYLSYTTGDRYRPASVGEAQRQLFERILGYRIDGSRLSRIGEDLAGEKADGPFSAAQPAGTKERLGDYRILREIGRGAMGIVFEAIQESLGRRVALKVLPGTFALDPTRIERFRREARATAMIHHPNIIPVYEVGESAGTYFYAMEYIDGPSLGERIEEARELARKKKGAKSSSAADPEYIRATVEQTAALAEGLDQAHRLGLVHRDIKPSNILADSGGQFVLVDFGLVREEQGETLTRSGEMVGTPSYMSPEQVSRRRADARSDVYSLGATLYEAVTLRAPFEGKSDAALQNAILFEEPPPPRQANPRLNRDLETILLHALEKNPEKRYQTAGELAADLRRLLRYEPIKARPRSTLTKLFLRVRRHGRAIAAAGLALALLLALGLLARKEYSDRLERRAAIYREKVFRAFLATQGAWLPSLDPGEWQLEQGALQSFANVERVERALAELEDAAGLVPGDPEAPFHAARARFLLGREEEALADLERALERRGGFVPALALQAAILEKRGDAAAARRKREEAEKSAGEGWAAAWLEAFRAKEARDWPRAAKACGRLTELARKGEEPYSGAAIEARLGKGLALLEAKDFENAAYEFRRACDDWHELPEPALLLAKAYWLDGKKQKARETLEALHQEAPSKEDAALAIAALFGPLLQEHEEALRWADLAKNTYLGERFRTPALWNLGRLDEAIEAGESAVRLNPLDARSHAYLSWPYWSSGQREQAWKALDEALRLDPSEAIVRFTRGSYFQQSGRYEEAIPELELAARRLPGNPWPYQQLAMAHNGRKAYGAALASAQRALEIDPDFPGGYLQKGLALEALNRPVAALEAYLEGYRRNYERNAPGQSMKARLLKLLATRGGELAGEEAAGALSKLEAMVASGGAGKGDPYALAILAEILRARGDLPGAILALERGLPLPNAAPDLAARLEELRLAALPALPTCGSADAALDRAQTDALVPVEALWKYRLGPEEAPAGWTEPGFDAASWDEGPSPFGYGVKAATALAGMEGRTTTAYFSHPFRLAGPSRFSALRLRIAVDDGCAAWLNGKEVGRIRAGKRGEPLPADATASELAPDPLSPVLIEIDPGLLRDGENCLALQGLNISLSSSDFLLAPILEARPAPDPSRDRAVLDRFRSAPEGKHEPGSPESRMPSRGDVLLYLEARILQLERKYEEAAAKLAELGARDPRAASPPLRLAECLRAAGAPERAADVLRRALATGLAAQRELWDLWLAVSFVDLHRSPAELRAGFPAPAALPAEKKESTAWGDPAGDVLWLLEQLAESGAVRINCGGLEHRAGEEAWGRDRFSSGGFGHLSEGSSAIGRSYSGSIRNARVEEICGTQRWFPPDLCRAPAYRIPLPPGDYTVALHFAEIYYQGPGKRVFEVRLEGEARLRDFDPFREAGGFAAAVERAFDVAVEDGMLDLEFVHVVENPAINGLEIVARSERKQRRKANKRHAKAGGKGRCAVIPSSPVRLNRA